MFNFPGICIYIFIDYPNAMSTYNVTPYHNMTVKNIVIQKSTVIIIFMSTKIYSVDINYAML